MRPIARVIALVVIPALVLMSFVLGGPILTLALPPLSSAPNAANHPVSRGRMAKPPGQCMKQTPSPAIAYL